jgi:hypothetical protein
VKTTTAIELKLTITYITDLRSIIIVEPPEVNAIYTYSSCVGAGSFDMTAVELDVSSVIPVTEPRLIILVENELFMNT